MNDLHPAVVEGGKALPPVGYFAAHLAGISLPDIINFFMLIYAIGLAVQTVHRGWRWWKRRKFEQLLRN